MVGRASSVHVAAAKDHAGDLDNAKDSCPPLEWELECTDEQRMAWLRQPPRALHILALWEYSKAGVHHGITSLSGILSGRLACTALHVEQAMLGSRSLLTMGHPKARQ
jgi:hypothetical protein